MTYDVVGIWPNKRCTRTQRASYQKNGGVWCTDGLDGTSGIATFLDFAPGEYAYAVNIVNNSNQCNL